MSQYAKGIVAGLIAIAIIATQAIQAGQSDGEWTNNDTIVTVLAVLGALGVYFVPNSNPEVG